MQRSYKILIIGTAILAIGIILITLTFALLNQSSFSISTNYDTIAPGRSILKTFDTSTGTNMAISVNYQPSNVPLNVQIIQGQDLTKMLDVNFTNKLFTNFIPKKDGVNNILITNLGSEPISGNIAFGNNEFFDNDGQPRATLGATAIAGPLLSFIGIVVLIIGGIFYFIDRRRIRKLKDQKQNH
jgi:uncharacterized membrane protein